MEKHIVRKLAETTDFDCLTLEELTILVNRLIDKHGKDAIVEIEEDTRHGESFGIVTRIFTHVLEDDVQYASRLHSYEQQRQWRKKQFDELYEEFGEIK